MSFKELFPYEPPRQGQQELVGLIQKALEEERTLLVEAPSGFGKTVCVLSAFDNVARSHEEYKLIFLARTRREVARVIEEYMRVSQKLTSLKPISFLPRFELCLKRRDEQIEVERALFSAYCNHLVRNRICQYYERTHALPIAALISLRRNLLEDLLATSRHNALCPYEALLRLALNSNVLVMTYRYFFLSFRNYLVQLLNAVTARLCYVIDEAHSLFSSLTSLFSVALSGSLLHEALAEVAGSAPPALTEQLGLLKANLGALAGELSKGQAITGEEAYMRLTSGLHHTLDRIYADLRATSLQRTLAASPLIMRSHASVGVLEALERLTSLREAGMLKNCITFVPSYKPEERSTILIKCIRPSLSLSSKPLWRGGKILLSATLGSPEVLRRLLDLEGPITYWTLRDAKATLPGLLCIVDAALTSRLRERSQANLREIGERLSLFVASIPGNTCLFFSSYAMMKAVKPHLLLPDNIVIMTEERQLSMEEAENMMRLFKANLASRALLMAVQNGRFSEGEDFPPDSIQGVAIVGLALPQPKRPLLLTLRALRPSLRLAYTHLFLRPAIEACLQCIGRALRAKSKKIVVYLLDKRFLSPQVSEHLPEWLLRDAKTISDKKGLQTMLSTHLNN